MRTKSALFLAAALLVATLAPAASAKERRGEQYGRVTAHSQYGHGSISAPTRRGQFGPELRLPGGTWISCKQDCTGTLRAETVDFWAERQSQQPSCGNC